MTGREQKVYYSYRQMSQKHSVPEETPLSIEARDQKGSSFALPELEHNLQLLIDLTEQDILQVCCGPSPVYHPSVLLMPFS